MEAMTNVMDEVIYSKNFNHNPKDHRHPLFVTERHFVYHLQKDDLGYLACVKDSQGRPLRSPRMLRDMCICKLVSESHLLATKTDGELLPSNVYKLLLSEAMYQREARAIEWLVSTWPMQSLRVYDFVPPEDYLEDDYLTITFEADTKTCLVDCFVLGLLKLREVSNLTYVDFSSFEQDRTLCRELSRLPILWMKPSNRTVDQIHDCISKSVDITKDKAEKFLNRISVVYSNIDGEFKHGNKIEPITINLDLKVTLDDVPIGLSLQQYTPFRFSCHRLWLKVIPDVGITPNNLSNVLNTNSITHFEFEEVQLFQDDTKWLCLLRGLSHLTNLVALGLPGCIDAIAQPRMAEELSSALLCLKLLRRLDLSYCNLHGRLSLVLGSLQQAFTFLSLKDCRLSPEDLAFLSSWAPLCTVCELNLSCNSSAWHDSSVECLLEALPHLVCLSLSFCALSIDTQMLVCTRVRSRRLRILCMQGYTPLPRDDILEILSIMARISSVQKVCILPAAYGFPGNNEQERHANKQRTLRLGYRYLTMRGRPDIELE